MPNPPYAELQLKTNPFSPEWISNGKPVKFDYLKTLSPQQDATYLNYYFDHYTWKDKDQIHRIGPNGRIKEFPAELSQPGMVIVISGASQTGRSSLENLLMFEVEDRVRTKPIYAMFNVDISVGKIQIAQNFANRFAKKVGEYLADQGRAQEGEALSKELRETVMDWRATLAPGETNTQFLFEELTDNVRKVLPDTPIVFSLNATNHINTADAWSPLCFMLRDLANFVIISLSNFDDAGLLRTILRDKQVRAAWIDAPRVGFEQIERFLTERLAIERTAADAPALFPFTREAIKALFAPSRPGDKDIDLSIGVAIKKLKGAFESKCATLEAMRANAPAAGIAPDSLMITDADMKQSFSGR